MILNCLRTGFGEARRHPGVAVWVWLVSLALAAGVAAPFRTWWGQAFDFAPRGDALLGGIDVATLTDLTHYDRFSASSLIGAGLATSMFLALLVNPFLAGGILAVIGGAGDERPAIERFCRGGVLFYWRFLKLLLLSVAGAGVAVAGGLALVRLVTARFADSLTEPWAVAAGGVRLLVAAALLVLAALALDYARVVVALTAAPRVTRAWLSAIAGVVRHPVATPGIAVAIVLPYLVFVTLYVAFRLQAVPVTWLLILLGLFVQQALLIARASLRVAQLGAEVEFARRALLPRPPIETSATPLGDEESTASQDQEDWDSQGPRDIPPDSITD